MLKNKKIAILATLIAMLLWGSAIPTIKTTYAELGVTRADTGAQILIAGIRFFLAGVLGFLYLKVFNKEKIEKDRVSYKYILTLSLIQTFIQYLIYYIALSNTQGVKAAIIQSTNAFMVVIISMIILPQEKVHPNTILAIGIGTLGILVVNGGLAGLSSQFNPLGEGLILISTFFNALASVYVRKNGKDQNEFLVTASQFILGSIPLIIIGLLTNTKTPSIYLQGSASYHIRSLHISHSLCNMEYSPETSKSQRNGYVQTIHPNLWISTISNNIKRRIHPKTFSWTNTSNGRICRA